MKKFHITTALLFSALLFAQKTEITNPKGKWYFGAELGINKSYQTQISKPSNIKFGILAEYYFDKQWSILSKVEYFKTAVNYSNNPELEDSYLGGGFSSFFYSDYDPPKANPYNSLDFEGSVISIPINVKWEFSLIKNFRAYFSLGPRINFETKSNYTVPGVENPDVSMFKKIHLGYGSGFGFTYFIDKNLAFVFSNEFSSGGYKGKYGNTNYQVNNRQTNIGFKYSFR